MTQPLIFLRLLRPVLLHFALSGVDCNSGAAGVGRLSCTLH